MKNTFKSTGAVLAGIIVNVMLSTGTDFVLEKLGIFSSPEEGFFTPWMLMLALFYRMVYAVAGGYVTAAMAPAHPMRHVIILGCIGIVLGSIGVVIGWNLSAHWYPIALVITAFPCTWYGGRLKTKKIAALSHS